MKVFTAGNEAALAGAIYARTVPTGVEIVLVEGTTEYVIGIIRNEDGALYRLSCAGTNLLSLEGGNIRISN